MIHTLLLFVIFHLFYILNADESLSSEREKEDASVDGCLPHQKASGVESSASYGVKKPQRGCAAEKRFEKPCPATESLQRHKLASSDEKPQISCKCGKASGNVTVHQCNNTGENPLSCPGRDMTPGHKRNVKSHQECWDRDQRASLHTEEELQQTETSAPCQTVCCFRFCRYYEKINTWSFHCLFFLVI